MPNELDVHYESLKANLDLLEPSSHEHQVIVRYMEATRPQWGNARLQHVWKVRRDKVVRACFRW